MSPELLTPPVPASDLDTPDTVTPPRAARLTTRDATDYVRWFDDITKADVPVVGGKGANLGEMTRAGFPVPPGFVVTVDAYRRFADATGVGSRIREQLSALDVDDPDQLRRTSDAIQSIVRNAPFPDDVRAAVLAAYARLARDDDHPDELVAVRSSGTVEDTAQFSFAGMFQSTLNVRGAESVIRAVKDCWASGFTARLLFYQAKQGLAGDVLIAAVVQRMVASERAGVVFTVNPASNDANRLVIEAAWGLGEVVVLGEVTPDHIEVDKRTLGILSRTVAHKEFMLVRNEVTGLNTRVPLSPERADAPVLTDEEVRVIADLARRDEEHYGVPQDAEWAIEEKLAKRPDTDLRKLFVSTFYTKPLAEILPDRVKLTA